MIVGIDVVNEGRLSIVGMTATYTNCLTQHFSRAEYQDQYKSELKKG
jgi:hypothetical protein